MVTAALLSSTGCEEDTVQPCGSDWQPVELPSRNQSRVSISQGVWGDVWFWEGNFQPNCPSGEVHAVSREMRIYELTSIQQVDHLHGGFYENITTELLATAWSDADGFFQVPLPVGRYSVFSVEDTLLYGNGGDGAGNISPIEVIDGKVTGIRFDIDYEAAY